MKNIFFAILLMVCGVAYGQKELQQKLEIQKIELKQQALEDKVAVQDKRIDEKIAAQDKRIDEVNNHLDNSLSWLSIVATLITVGLGFGGFFIISGNREAKQKLEQEMNDLKAKMAEDIESVRKDAKTSVEQAIADIDIKKGEIETLLEEAKGDVEYISNTKKLVEKIQSNKEGEDNKEIQEETKRTVEEIDEKLPVAQYTLDDWFLKAYDAQERKKYEDAIFYYRKAGELKGFDAESEKVRAAVYNNSGFALFNLAKQKGTLIENQEVIREKLLKAHDLGNSASLYNLARIDSLLNKKDEAFEWFDKALQKLWENKTFQERIESDPDIDNLRQDPRFEELLNKYRPLKEEE